MKKIRITYLKDDLSAEGYLIKEDNNFYTVMIKTKDGEDMVWHCTKKHHSIEELPE